MKKILLLIFIFCFGAPAFAADFVISPTVGYQNNIGYQDNGGLLNDIYDGYVYHGAQVGVSIGTIAKNGFTFYFNNSVGFMYGTIYCGHDGGIHAQSVKRRITYLGELLFGRTFFFRNDSLHLGILGGVNFGYIGNTAEHRGMCIGPCVSINVDYFFTKQAGITFSLTECPNWYILAMDNIISVRFGAKFRL